MKAFLALVLTLVALPALAQNNRRDGNWWNEQPQSLRATYILGLFDGTDVGFDFSVWEGKSEEWTQKAQHSWEKYTSTYLNNVTAGQLSDGLTALYKDFRNRSIPIRYGVWIVLNQISGTSTEQVEQLLENFRKVK